jgi:hypothetical protein
MSRIVSIDLEELRLGATAALLAGTARWTVGDTVLDVEADHLISVPAETLHGFRNTGSVPLLVVSVHESPTLIQTFIGREPAHPASPGGRPGQALTRAQDEVDVAVGDLLS